MVQEASVAVDLDERFERIFDQEKKTWKIKETSLTIFVSMIDVITDADPIPKIPSFKCVGPPMVYNHLLPDYSSCLYR